MNEQELLLQIEAHRRAIEELEARLQRLSTGNRSWVPGGFYTSYYVLMGLILGLLAAWVSLAFNVVGALISGLEPLKLIRVYATFFDGENALATTQGGMMFVVALMLHSATGAVVGAPLHVVYSRFFSGHTVGRRLLNGVWLGIVMWIVNFYLLLSWVQPLVLDWLGVAGAHEAFILREIPFWVAAVTHICFTVTMLVMQPYWSFDARNYASTSSEARA
jgi:hypothetical protein